MRSAPLFRILLLSLSIGTCGLLTGCATTSGGHDQEESDLPWATPESWEGSPLIPGFENR